MGMFDNIFAGGGAAMGGVFGGAAAYVQDNPTYLVNPGFDPTINIAGDESE